MTVMLVTRPEPDARATASHLDALGIDALICPMLNCVTLNDAAIPDPKAYAGLALTSANGLRSLAEIADLSEFTHLPLYAVGNASAEEAASLGFINIHNAGGALAELAETIVHNAPGGRILHPAGVHRSGDLARSVAEHGVSVDTIAIYDMQPTQQLPTQILDQFESGSVAAILFYSQRTAATFIGCLGDRLEPRHRAAIEVLCLSEKVAEPLLNAHFTRISLADRPDEDAMMALALAFAREQNRA
ncbi:hypothetical protein GCM10007989_18840 [Devosia pacifica]|uniref:Uroporphyrinogen-III synthase n=1 Tax=Devosia pacifica TaxID=1335967 RepID=A0A918VTV5_9HYPH|nr:uroporphyrinogen-III synthase [Devosia pacifica]GHA23588.1 hypothetical protein GCM10007989_18840 [Devosia pacifica]